MMEHCWTCGKEIEDRWEVVCSSEVMVAAKFCKLCDTIPEALPRAEDWLRLYF